MSDDATIVCRVIRPLWLRGRSYAAGATFEASPREAALVLESTRGELVHAADLARIRVASQAATNAALKTAALLRPHEPRRIQ